MQTLSPRKESNGFGVSPFMSAGAGFKVVKPTSAEIENRIMLQFSSKEELDDFLEEVAYSKNSNLLPGFKKAEKESKGGKAKSMEVLFKKYGV